MGSKTKIVAIEKGWVIVGIPTVENDVITIANARCIRHWGTTRGLGELVDGPLPNTVLDEMGTIQAPLRSVIFKLTCNRDW